MELYNKKTGLPVEVGDKVDTDSWALVEVLQTLPVSGKVIIRFKTGRDMTTTPYNIGCYFAEVAAPIPVGMTSAYDLDFNGLLAYADNFLENLPYWHPDIAADAIRAFNEHHAKIECQPSEFELVKALVSHVNMKYIKRRFK